MESEIIGGLDEGTQVEKTGQECGMNDANYFSRILRKQKGLHRGSIGECEIWSDCKSI